MDSGVCVMIMRNPVKSFIECNCFTQTRYNNENTNEITKLNCIQSLSYGVIFLFRLG